MIIIIIISVFIIYLITFIVIEIYNSKLFQLNKLNKLNNNYNLNEKYLMDNFDDSSSDLSFDFKKENIKKIKKQKENVKENLTNANFKEYITTQNLNFNDFKGLFKFKNTNNENSFSEVYGFFTNVENNDIKYEILKNNKIYYFEDKVNISIINIRNNKIKYFLLK